MAPSTPMVKVSDTPITRGLLPRLTALVLLSATLFGCTVIPVTTSRIEKIARSGEPEEDVSFALSASTNAYEITRWWVKGPKDYGLVAFSIPRRDLPAGCETARFFLNDSANELQIAQRKTAAWITGVRPPVPDGSYPPCALLVSYGFFSEPPALDGVAVTSTARLVAKSERKKPVPAAWALMPAGLFADIYLTIGAVLTAPVWVPIAAMSQSSTEDEKREKAAEAKGKLPPPVAACWTAIESAIKRDGSFNSEQPFFGFEWVPGGEDAYVLTAANDVFSDDNTAPIDARVTLNQGRVQFLTFDKDTLWTEADIECGLRSGEVVATRVKLRK
jgi:hypothetical protein